VDRVGIVATGQVGFSSISPGLSYKELVFEAAMRAYAGAGVDPRRDVDSFVCASEDFLEGTSIFDEYVPDQLGAAQRPVQTVAADGLVAIATGVMLIRSGVAAVVACEAHSKASDIVTLPDILAFALDPVFERPLGVHPWFVAGLEMTSFLAGATATIEDCWQVAATNRCHALRNPSAAYAEIMTPGDVEASALVADPLRELDCPRTADGAVVVVLAAEDRARALCPVPVWVDGIGWSTESPSLSTRTWGSAEYARRAAARAYALAGVTDARAEIDVAEVDDTFSYKQLQHLDALGLRHAPTMVNPSGGSLGRGYLFEANGLARVADVAAQLRGQAGACQVDGARRGLVQSWRGVPTSSGAVAVLSVDA
jgi:acetyl-CoA C-acetyltransferase